MKVVGRLLVPLLAAALAASCASVTGRGAAAGGVDVTRTHLGQEIARAQIAVEPVDLADANTPEFRAFAAAVERQLVRLGWTLAPDRTRSEQIARIDVQQGSRQALTSGWPPGLAPGGRDSNLVATLLDVRIQRRSDGTVAWQGRAVTEAQAGSPAAERTAAVENLAEALFRDFPGESGRTVRLRLQE